LEWIRAQGPFGFPWGQAADALYQIPSAIQASSLGGIWIVTFLIVLVNALLAQGWARRRWPEPVVALLIVGLALGGGSFTLPSTSESAEARSVRIVQPSIPQSIRSDASQLAAFRSIYRELMGQIDTADSDLTILPESILPTYVLDDADVLAQLTDWAQEHDQTLLFGTYRRAEGATHNSSVAVSPEGNVADAYDKNHLVPFSTEYFPGKPLLRRAGLFDLIPVGDRLGLIDPGQAHRSLKTDLGRIATPICFESIFPRIGRTFARNGAELIVIVTNDAWFKTSWALPQHFAKAVFRAVETRRDVVQAANSGVSGIVDAQGRIQARSGINERTVLGGTVRTRDRETLYTRWGDWWIGLSALYLGIAALSSSGLSRRRRPG
jgi:apolipoprotein N-acyltransferase